MSKIRKRFERIMNNPKEIKWNELRVIAEHYGLTVENPKGGSHFIVYHHEDPENTMIPVPVHSNRVKTIYVKKIIALIEETCSEEE